MDDDAWNGAASRHDSAEHGPSPGAMDELIALYLTTLRDIIAALPASEERLKADERWGLADERRILFLLAQAQAAWLTSGLRYWRQMAEILATQGIGLGDAARDDAAWEQDRLMRHLLLVDKARAALREVADLSLSEAKALRRKLLEIEGHLRAAEAGPDGAEPRRYGKVKP
ncbi:MAG: hypothetical protein AAGE18_03120 [Pseudomonadota bacterium]